MKKYILIFLFGCICIPSFAQNTLGKIQAELRNPNSKNVLVISHRGDWRNAPENSIQAIRRAIEMGVDIIEIDLQLTRDKQLVLMHDRTIDRTTNGKGLVSEYSLEELGKFTLRTGAASPTRQHIPTFEEAMLEMKGKVLVNVDKGFEYFDLVYEVLKKTGTVDQAIIKSSLPGQNAADRYEDLIKDVIYMPMCNVGNSAAISSTKSFVKENKSLIVEMNFSDTTNLREHIAAVRAQYPVKIWFNSLWGGIDDELAVDEGNPEAAWGWLIAQGGRAIQTDRPKELIDYLRKKGLHP